MSNNEARGKNDCPTDRRIDAPHGEERDHSTGDESAAEDRCQAGAGTPPGDGTTPGHEYPRGSTRRTVVAWLVENVDGLQYIKSSQIAADLTLSANQVGCALGKLVDDDLPVEIERWDSSADRATWRVERRAVADGGQYTTRADEIGVVDGIEVDITVRDTGAGERPADHTLIELKHHLGRIATALTTMPDIDTDAFYVLDAHRNVVVAGPTDEEDALTEAAERGTEVHLVVSGAALQQRADATTLAWETGEVRRVTDGGTPAWVNVLDRGEVYECDKCGAQADAVGDIEHGEGCIYRLDIVADGGTEGAIDNEFDEAEQSPRAQLEAGRLDIGAASYDGMVAGDVAIDLVTRQPLRVRGCVADDLVEYY
jgi:hypothetical protein